jgi:hypothetical protein
MATFGGKLVVRRAKVEVLEGEHDQRPVVMFEFPDMAAIHAEPGCTTVTVAEALHWSRPWDQMLGMQRRFAIGEAYSHLVHLEATGYVTNKGTDVDAWHALRDATPVLC